jgi:hypothetical protein
LTNARPSSIYRIKSLRPTETSTTNPTAMLGIQITTLDALAAFSPAVSSTSADATATTTEGASGTTMVTRSGPQVAVGVVAEKIVKNVGLRQSRGKVFWLMRTSHRTAFQLPSFLRGWSSNVNVSVILLCSSNHHQLIA